LGANTDSRSLPAQGAGALKIVLFQHPRKRRRPPQLAGTTSDAFSKARTGRSAGRAAHQVRIGDQSQDRQDARPRRADDATPMCRRGNRVRRSSSLCSAARWRRSVRAARCPRAAAGEVAGHRVPQQLVACKPQVELDQLVVFFFSRRPCLRWTPATLPADNGCPTLASAKAIGARLGWNPLEGWRPNADNRSIHRLDRRGTARRKPRRALAAHPAAHSCN
jgi:hypothetical protein